MPVWFFIALAGPVCWSISNYFDKFLLGRYVQRASPTLLIVFTGLFGVVAAPLIWLYRPPVLAVDFTSAALMLASGAAYLIGLIPYIHALQRDEATIVVPLFQMGPVIYLILGGLILGERLSPAQLMGGAVVLLGAVALSVEHGLGRLRVKARTLGLMVLASVLIALSAVLFKFVALEEDYWVSAFWQFLGEFMTAIVILLVIVPVRRVALELVKLDGARFLGFNALNDVVNFLGAMLSAYATLLAPIALVSLANGFQPFFILLFGLLWSRLFPHYGVERLSGTTLARKLVSVAVMFGGIAIIQLWG